MINDSTSHLKLPLPHKDNYLEDDVPRLRDAFNGVDLYAQGTDLRLEAAEQDLTTKADAAGTGAALLAVGQRLDQVAAELAGGIPTLSDAVDSAVSTVAASSKAVKTAFDKGGEALTTASAAKTAAGNAQNTANEAKAAAQAAQGAIANVNPYKIGEFKNWFEQTPPAGWAVRNGQILYNADRDYPDLWAYLQQPANTWKCKTLAQWNGLSSAAGSVGGVPFFVLDASAKTIKLPDTRGDYERDAGSSYLQNVGGWHKDGIRNITGTAHNSGIGSGTGLLVDVVTGAFYVTQNTGAKHARAPYGHNTGLGMDISRIVPTAPDNRTRTYGVLGCVYVRRA